MAPFIPCFQQKNGPRRTGRSTHKEPSGSSSAERRARVYILFCRETIPAVLFRGAGQKVPLRRPRRVLSVRRMKYSSYSPFRFEITYDRTPDNNKRMEKVKCFLKFYLFALYFFTGVCYSVRGTLGLKNNERRKRWRFKKTKHASNNSHHGRWFHSGLKAIWENCQPVSLTLDKLRHGIPDSWEEQRKIFLEE